MNAPMPVRSAAPYRPLRRAPRLLLALALLLAYAAASLTGAHLPRAWSDTVPATGTLATVSSDSLPTVQIDGVVWAQLVIGNTVYVGGDFQTARPAGADPGVSTVPKPYLLAYNLTTGVMIPGFAPPFPDGLVHALAASPDGSTLYVGGNFDHLGTTARSKLAALDPTTGAVKTGFDTGTINDQVNALTATASTVYLAGKFISVGTKPHRSIAAVDATTGLVTTFNPIVTAGYGESIAVSPDQSKVVIGGRFTTTNGSSSPGYGMAIVDAATGGVNQPFATNTVVRNATDDAAITSLYAASDGFYGTGFDFSGGVEGNFEGTFKSSWSGDLIWLEDCHGDTYATTQPGGVGTPVYSTGHPHYCGNIGAFNETVNRTYHRALAFTPDPAPGGVIAPDPLNYPSFEGKPRPNLLTWFPDIDTGHATTQSQGAWTVGGNADYVLFGGEFEHVNLVGQQGLARFAKASLAPNTDRPRQSVNGFVPTLQSTAQGVRVSWPANYDRDNEQLTYTLIRDGQIATPIYTTTVRSTFWQRPMISFIDSTALPGQTHSYQLRVVDPYNNRAGGTDTSYTATTGPTLSPYDQKILNDDPLLYWRLDETSGTAIADLSGTGAAGTRQSGVTQGVPGAILGEAGTAYRLNGTSAAYAYATATSPFLQTYSTEVWFKTNSTTGGRLMGYSSAGSGTSTTADRHLYLTNSGKVYFGTLRKGRSGTIRQTVSSASGFNDNQWHLAVATQDITGTKLYLDGTRVASAPQFFTAQPYAGFWRIGGDTLTGWPEAPSSNNFTGDVDDPAVYNVALTSTQIRSHYTAGKGTNDLPTASFTSSCVDLTCTFDGSASSDPDGSISAYDWTFGDTTTGTGATTSRTYAAAGTYSVKLTVTDNNGGKASVTKTVSVTAPPNNQPFVSDTFDRTVASGFGTADTGGAWTATTSTQVTGGAGVYSLRAGGGPTAYLDATKRTDTDLTMNVTVDKVATGSGLLLNASGRRVNPTLDYRTSIALTSNAKAAVSLQALKDSTTATTLGSAVTLPDTIAAGDTFHLRMQTFGTGTTTVRAKLWRNGSSEPAAWTVSATDTYAGLQAPGSVGLGTYLSGAATNAPITVSLLDLSAKPTN